MKYVKRQVVVEAIQFTLDTAQEARDFCGGLLFDNSPERPFIIIGTLEGKLRVDLGDWVIKGVHGEFYPCKPDIFAETYMPVDIDSLVTLTAIEVLVKAGTELRRFSPYGESAARWDKAIPAALTELAAVTDGRLLLQKQVKALTIASEDHDARIKTAVRALVRLLKLTADDSIWPSPVRLQEVYDAIATAKLEVGL